MFQIRTPKAKTGFRTQIKATGEETNANQAIKKNKQKDRCRAAPRRSRAQQTRRKRRRTRCPNADRGGLGARTSEYQTSGSDYGEVLEPDYCKARLLEIGVGRRFWQSNPSPENAHTFYERVVQPLRRLQRRGVVETLQEITATDDRTPIAVEIIGQVDLTKVSKQ